MNVHKEEVYNKKFDLDMWKKLIRFMKPYRKTIIILIIVIIVVGGIDAVFTWLSKYAVDNFIVPGSSNGLTVFIVIYSCLIMVQSANVFLLIKNAGCIEQGISYAMRQKAFERLQQLSLSYYDKTPVGWIMARMTSDIRKLSTIVSWGIVDFTWGLTMMLAIIVVMLILNWKLALITLSVVPALAIVSMFFQKKILKTSRETQKNNSIITAAFNEGITGAKTTKTLVTESVNLDDFSVLTGNMRSSSIRMAVLSSLYLPIVLSLGSIGTALALWAGGTGVIANAISYGTLVAFLSYSVQFFEPVRHMAKIFSEFQSAQASGERILSLIDTEPEIKDSPKVIAKYGEKPDLYKNYLPQIKGNILFENVSFIYKDGEKVLDNFSLEVEAGETVALVGETGSGKSTIVNLACRFYQPTEGRILIDGIDYCDMPLLWLHSNLGYVLQTPHLFSGTIKDNIRYGKPGCSDMEITKVSKYVNAHEFITRLDKSYDSEVGEGGNKLSTGQKQLISFARAILANPRIFVLDEATSSIDTETEKTIQNAIHKVIKNRTSFIIAHRLSTIRSADKILVINKGKIVEKGNHEQLLKQRGCYYKLYNNQFLVEERDKIMSS